MSTAHRMNIEQIKRNTKDALERLYISLIDQYYEEIGDQIKERSAHGFNFLTFEFINNNEYPDELVVKVVDQLVKILRADGFDTSDRQYCGAVIYINISWQ